jgi:multiple sugar transport system substrate-binding protein
MITKSKRHRVGQRVIALLAATTLLLAACGEPEEPTEVTPDPEAPPAEPDVDELPSGSISFGNWQWLEEGRGDALWAAVSAYEDHNPNATLVQEATPFGDYADTLFTQMGAGVGPDVFITLDNQWVVLQDAGLLEPLDDAVAGAPLNVTNEALNIDGQQYGVTWEQVSYALLGNRNVMEEAGIDSMPSTVDELIEAGQQVQENTNADGFAVRHRIAEFAGWSADFQNWAYGFGGSWSDGEQLTFASDDNVEAVTEFKRVFDSGIMPIGDDASTFRSKFQENSLGFILDNSGAALSFATAGAAITGQDMVSAPVPFPRGVGAHQKLIIAVNANSENTELAKDFIRWFVTEEGQTLIRPPLGASTLATDVPLPDEFLEEHPWSETYVEIGPESKSLLIAGFEMDTMDLYQSIMEAVERVITEDQDPREALEQAQRAHE